MGRAEDHMRCMELRGLLREGAYEEALEIAEKMNIEKIKSIIDLKVLASVYERVERYADAKYIMKKSYQRKKTKMSAYRLSYLSIKTEEFDDAEHYYQVFSKMAPESPDRYILRYGIDRAKNVDYVLRIATLQKLKQIEYTEEWGYELAKIYHKAGLHEECIRECKDLIIWFGYGVIVDKAKLLCKYHEEGKEALDHYGLFDGELSPEELRWNRDRFEQETKDVQREVERAKEAELQQMVALDFEKTVDLRQILGADSEEYDLLTKEVHRSWGGAEQATPGFRESQEAGSQEYYPAENKPIYTADTEQLLADSISEIMYADDEKQAVDSYEWQGGEDVYSYETYEGDEADLYNPDGAYTNYGNTDMKEIFAMDIEQQESPVDMMAKNYQEPYAYAGEYEKAGYMEDGYVEGIYADSINSDEMYGQAEYGDVADCEEIYGQAVYTETAEETEMYGQAGYGEMAEDAAMYSQTGYGETAEMEADSVEATETVVQTDAEMATTTEKMEDEKQDASVSTEVVAEESQEAEPEVKQSLRPGAKHAEAAILSRIRNRFKNFRKKKKEDIHKEANIIGGYIQEKLPLADEEQEETTVQSEIQEEAAFTEPNVEMQENETVFTEAKVQSTNATELEAEEQEEANAEPEVEEETTADIEAQVQEEETAATETEAQAANAVEVEEQEEANAEPEVEEEITADIEAQVQEEETAVTEAETQSENVTDAETEAQEETTADVTEESETEDEEEDENYFLETYGPLLQEHFEKYQADTRLCEDTYDALERAMDGRRPLNFIVTCKNKERANGFCQELAKTLKDLGLSPKQQVARISAVELNYMHLEKNYEKLSGGLLLVEDAKKMTADTAQSILNLIRDTDGKIIVILSDARPYMMDLLNQYRQLKAQFPFNISMR